MSNYKDRDLAAAIGANIDARAPLLTALVDHSGHSPLYGHFNDVAARFTAEQCEDLVGHASPPQRNALMSKGCIPSEVWQGFVDLHIKRQGLGYMKQGLEQGYIIMGTRAEQDNIIAEYVASDVAHSAVAFDNMRLVLGSRQAGANDQSLTVPRINQIAQDTLPAINQTARHILTLLGRDFDTVVAEQRDKICTLKLTGSDYYAPLTPEIWAPGR